MRLRALEPQDLAARPDVLPIIQPRAKVALGLKGILLPIGVVSAASTAVLLIGLEAQDRWSSSPRHGVVNACDVVPDKPWWKWACNPGPAKTPADKAVANENPAAARFDQSTSPLARAAEVPSGAIVGWADLQAPVGASNAAADVRSVSNVVSIGAGPQGVSAQEETAQSAAPAVQELPPGQAPAQSSDAGTPSVMPTSVVVDNVPDVPDPPTLLAAIAHPAQPTVPESVRAAEPALLVTASLPEPETLAVLRDVKQAGDLARAEATIDASVAPITAIAPVPVVLNGQCGAMGCEPSDHTDDTIFLAISVPPVAPLGLMALPTAIQQSLPVQSLPAPSVPAPSVPTPSIPTPSVPAPSVPAPSLSAPSLSAPSVPTTLPPSRPQDAVAAGLRAAVGSGVQKASAAPSRPQASMRAERARPNSSQSTAKDSRIKGAASTLEHAGPKARAATAGTLSGVSGRSVTGRTVNISHPGKSDHRLIGLDFGSGLGFAEPARGVERNQGADTRSKSSADGRASGGNVGRSDSGRGRGARHRRVGAARTHRQAARVAAARAAPTRRVAA